MPVRCVLMPPNAQHACRSRAQPTCRSALRFGRRRPSFWRCVLSLLCRRGSPIPARPASHFCRPLEGFEFAFLGHPELVHRAAALSTVASPSTELRGSNAWSLPGRTLPSERPPPPSRRRDGRIVAGSAGAGWQRGRVGRAVGFPPLTDGGIGRIVPDYVRCSCT